MSKQHRTAGVDYREIAIGEKTYKMRPLTVGAYAELEAYIVSKRPDPLALASQAAAKAPASQHDAIWRAAMDRAMALRTVTPEEAQAFEDSMDGLAWKFWQCIRQDHPEVDSIQAAKELIISAGDERLREIAVATELASGEADLGNSTGPAEVPAGEAQAGQ